MITEKEIERYTKEYYSDVFRFCLSKLKDKDDAFDATQETFLLLKTKSFDLTDINIKAWLMWVAHYMVKDIYNRRSKESKLLSEYTEETLPIDKRIETIETQIVDNNIEKYTMEIYNGLPDSDKELFGLLYVKNMSEKSVAEKLSLEPHALYMRVSRLKKRIADFIRNEFVY